MRDRAPIRLARVIVAAALAAGAGAAQAAPPVVTSVYPEPHRVDAGAQAVIEVRFDQPVDPATVDNISFRVFGRWSGPAAGTRVVMGSTITFTPDQPFFAGEYVTVSVSKAVQNFSAEPMAKGYAFAYWIATAGGDLDLVYDGRHTCRQGGETWVQPYGAYGGDIDNDGDSDLTIPNEQTSDVRVFLNNAGNYSTFAVESITGGSTPSPSEGGDFDNDGEIDVVVANTANDKVSLLFGDGTGDFPNGRKTSYTCASSVRGVGVVDLNGDGWDDIVTGNRFGNNLSILINDGDGTFAPAVAKETGTSGEWGIAIADANNDGQLDVFCSSRNSPYSIVVLLSDGNGGLAAQTPVSSGNHCWQLVVGDFDLNGNVDVAGCASSGNALSILYGNGAGGFVGTVITLGAGSFPLAVDTGDIDGDGDLELVASNYDGGTWTVYENVNGSFVNPRTLNASSAGSEAVLHDVDGDGDLDMTGVDEVDDYIYHFTNEGTLTAVTPGLGGRAALYPNTPNPFNPSTAIRFELAGGGDVDLSVYDAAGAFVARLAHGYHAAGTHDVRWNGTDARGARVSSGVYFSRLTAAGVTLTGKMVLLK